MRSFLLLDAVVRESSLLIYGRRLFGFSCFSLLVVMVLLHVYASPFRESRIFHFICNYLSILFLSPRALKVVSRRRGKKAFTVHKCATCFESAPAPSRRSGILLSLFSLHRSQSSCLLVSKRQVYLFSRV